VKNIVSWDVKLHALVEAHRRFGGTYCLHQSSACCLLLVDCLLGLLCDPEDGIFLGIICGLVTRRRHIPEDSTLQAMYMYTVFSGFKTGSYILLVVPTLYLTKIIHIGTQGYTYCHVIE
jgi:hypothetical protein